MKKLQGLWNIQFNIREAECGKVAWIDLNITELNWIYRAPDFRSKSLSI